jgi:hypothetical protein
VPFILVNSRNTADSRWGCPGRPFLSLCKLEYSRARIEIYVRVSIKQGAGVHVVGVATMLRTARCGVRTPVGFNFSETSRPAMGPIHPPTKWVRGSFQEIKRPGPEDITHFNLVSKLRMSGLIPMLFL